MVAKFFDGKLRTGYKECTEEQLDEIFDRVMVLFRLVSHLLLLRPTHRPIAPQFPTHFSFTACTFRVRIGTALDVTLSF